MKCIKLKIKKKNCALLFPGYAMYRHNTTSYKPQVEEDSIISLYEDGHWSKPYFDCGGGDIWMMTYTVPFFGYKNGRYHFK